MSNILRNHWYLAAWSEELSNKPVGRRICDIPMVLFRDPDGTAAVLRDRCPHRFAPLSQGEVNSQGIVCPYHGLVFDGSGACVHNPFGPAPAAAKVASFPLVERDGCVWLWHGDADRVDYDAVPDYSDFLTGEKDGAIWQRVTLEGPLIIGVENLMDLTHSSFLHVPTIPHWEQFNFKDSKLKAGWEGDWLKARWTFDDDDGNELFWIQSDWQAAGTMRLSSSTDPSGKHRDPPYRQLHVYTPETETTTHYFTADQFDGAVEDIEEARARAALLAGQVFSEDNRIISAVQAEMGEQDFFDMEPVLLSIDKAAVMARRHFDKLLAEQSAEG